MTPRRTKRGVTWAIRFRAYGRRRYVTLGSSGEGWTERRAEEELANVLADVRRGIWRPSAPEAESSEPEPEPTFHAFASEWFARREAEGLRARSLECLRWALADHLLAHLAQMRLSEITVADVDGYVQLKAAKGLLSNASVNKTLDVLAQVMELAVEYEMVDRNPARGRRRRLPVSKPARTHLEPAQLRALLDAAGELDAEDRAGRRYRRTLLATLGYAGPRVGELLALRWRDVNLAGGRLRVRESKTESGVREVDIQPELHDELAALKARTAFSGASDLVFRTGTGRAENRNNVRRRVLLRAAGRANERIARDGGCEPLPEGLSPHALRRTFASWLVAEGEDAAYVMAQLGHTDPKMTLGLYARALRSERRRPHAGARAAQRDPRVPEGGESASRRSRRSGDDLRRASALYGDSSRSGGALGVHMGPVDERSPLAVAASQRDTGRRMSEENVELVRRGMESAEAFWALLDEYVVWDLRERPLLDLSDVQVGRDAVIKWSRHYWGTWDEYRLDMEELIDAGASAIVALREGGRGKGSGVPFDRRWAQVWTFARGKIIRWEMYPDKATALEAAGIKE